MDTDVSYPSIGYTPFIFLSIFVAAVTYYVLEVAKKPTVYTSNGKLRRFLQNNVKSANEKFYPHYLIWEGRLQSIFGLHLRVPDSYLLPYAREIFKLKDGGELALDFLSPKLTDDESLIVFILPGLTSSSQTCYVKTLVMAVVSAGGIAVVLNNRGLGGVELKNPRLYCAANCDDVEEVIEFLNERYPNSRKIAIGTSMGAMVISRYLGLHPEEAKKTFTAVLTISSLWDAGRGVENLEKPFINKYIINHGITQNLVEIAIKYRDILEVRGCFDYSKILQCSSVREFDTFFTAPSFGFKSVDEYYTHATTTETIPKFSVPVFGLNAEDDPFSPVHALPIREAQKSGSNFALITTVRGGHVGFIEGILPTRRASHFLERFVAEFVYAIRFRADELLVE